ncbi:MAG: DUF4062 domain-containing protein, partial [Nitrososphaera sp.]
MAFQSEEKLEVFISSKEEEFKQKRKRLAKRINSMDYLKCELLEDRGADSDDVHRTSVEAAKACHIYVGIFGRVYSKDTVDECRAALDVRNRCLAYVQIMRNNEREAALQKFIDEELYIRLKYHAFRKCKELEEQIIRDIRKQMVTMLKAGHKNLAEVKEDYKIKERNVNLALSRAPTAENKMQYLLEMAEQALSSGNYLSALVTTYIYLEQILRNSLARKTGRDYRTRPFHYLVNEALGVELIDKRILNMLLDYRNIRNKAVHDGISPTKKDAETLVSIVKKLSTELAPLTEFFEAEVLHKKTFA